MQDDCCTCANVRRASDDVPGPVARDGFRGPMTAGRSAQAIEAFAQTAGSPNLRRAQLSFAAAFSSHWAMMVALGILAFHHGGAAAVGVVGLVSMLPAALLTPAAGALVDRYRRDRVLLGVCLVRTAALIAAAISSGRAGLLI